MSKISGLLFLAILALSNCQHSPPKPNIILIMTDDQGWFDTGFNGNDEILTPWIDSLASQGVILDRFYSASAVCSPTRASVLTGRNPLRMNIPYANSGHMKEEEITIPELLREEGYATGHFGKWHLGTLTRSVLDANRGGREEFDADFSIPAQHGYDVSFCTESKVPTFDPMVKPAEFRDAESLRYGWRAESNRDSTIAYGTAYWTGAEQKVESNLDGDNSRVIMDRVIPFIENPISEARPFFTTIWFHTPHLPVVSDSIHRSSFSGMDIDKQIYYGTILALDEQIGRLWQKLEASGIQEETIIFFCSDNGPEQGTPGSAGNFRERKRSLYEGGVRVPAFVVWKNIIAGGKRTSFPMFTSDYLPTILDILNMEYPDSRPIDGISILPALHGDQTERNSPIGFIANPRLSWVTDQYKLIGDIGDGKGENFELFDLLNDRSEKENVIGQYPEVANSMKAELLEWLSSVENSNNGRDY